MEIEELKVKSRRRKRRDGEVFPLFTFHFSTFHFPLFTFHFPLFTLLFFMAVVPADGAEIVSFSSPTNRHARTRVTGEVLEYTGEQIVIKLPDGREIKRPGKLVAAIESDWPPEQREADRLFAEHQFQAAREKYTAAIRQESRRWVRREMFARLIACHRELGQFDAAGKLFLAIAHDDPQTPHFDQIPLRWLPGESSPTLEQAAIAWLNDERPLAALLGASHLLNTSRQTAALARLEQLAGEKDRRIASLAEAQSWRAKLVTADESQLDRWRRRVEDFPEPLRAGPYWAIGRALAQHGAHDDAVLMLLRVPILYPETRSLAADALATAAELLGKQGDTNTADRLRSELLAAYPESRQAKQLRTADGVRESVGETISKPAGDTLEEAFLAGLRARRLFASAASECRLRLADTAPEEPQRIVLSVEQSRTFVEQALEQLPDQREPLWRQALEAVAENGQAAKPQGSRRLLLGVQLGLVHLARGEVARQEAEIAGSPDDKTEAARRDLRAAVTALEQVAAQAAQALRRANQTKRPDLGDLDSSELLALQRNLGFQLARALRNQGQSYPPQSADRTNSLRQAAEKFAEIGDGDSPDDISWRSRLDEIICLRLLEDFQNAAARLTQLASLEPPPAIAAGARAEQIRLALAVRRLPDALRAADAALAGVEQTADLAYACLEAYASAWRAATESGDGQKSSLWQDRAAALVRQIDARYGPYWSRRADMLLAAGIARGGGSDNLTVLVRAAESFYRNGQIDQALAAYDRAVELAGQAKQPDVAFEQAYTAAAIEQQRGNRRQAAERFRRLALSLPSHPKASEAHLLAIYNTAHDTAPARTPSLSTVSYLTLFQEHLQHWPAAATANQARMWLGGVEEHGKQWADAIAAYRGVTPDSDHAVAAVEAAARSYQQWLSELARAGKPNLGIATEAARYFESMVMSPRGDLPERWSQTQRVAATSAATLWLQHTDDYDQAERLLAAALTEADDAPAEWRTAARSLLVFAVAAQGRRDEAARQLGELADGAPEQLLLVIEGLGRLAGKAAPTVRRELAELQLQAAALVRAKGDAISNQQRRALDLAVVRGLAAAGRMDEAVKSARQFAAASPRDGETQEEYARLLVDAAEWPEALSAWRAIQHKCREGSDRWLRSIYYQAQAMEHLGKSDDAARLVKLTEALHPDLGGPDLKTRFHELLRRCLRSASASP